MSNSLLFAIGGVLFIITTGATIAFLLSRVMAAHRRQLLESESVSHIESDRFTEIYVRDDVAKMTVPAGIDAASGSVPPER